MTTIGDVLEKIDKEKLADNKQMKLLGKQIQESVLNGMMNNKNVPGTKFILVTSTLMITRNNFLQHFTHLFRQIK